MDKIFLQYCNRHMGTYGTSTCAEPATVRQEYMSKDNRKRIKWMCERHKFHKQSKKPGLVLIEVDQKEKIEEINQFLKGYIGKPIFSNYHRNKVPYIGKFLKENGSIMCLQEHSKSWHCIYYYQIIEGDK